MNARALEQLTASIRHKRRRSLEALALSAVTAAGSAAAAAFSPRLAVALAAGAGIEAALAAASAWSRRELVARLALEPWAYEIPEVREYGWRLTLPKEREKLGRWLREVLIDAFLPGSIYLPDRVAAYAGELERLARDLLSPAVSVRPTSAVACLRLLTRGPESPLYNPRLSAEELGSMLGHIRAGIEPSG